MTTGATRKLCEFIEATNFEDIPADAVDVAKVAILNIIGTSLGGYETRIGKMHVELAKDWGGGKQEATIFADGTKVALPMAVYANGNLGFALDYEDMIHYIVHPGFITTSSALAVCEQRGLSGRDLLTSVILGFEIGGRLGDCMQPTPERGGQVWGEQYHPFCSATVAGKLIGLDAQQLDAAFGIAGTYSTVPSVYKYFGKVEETRPMREVKMGWGWMAMAGVTGALTAEKGFSGGFGILDGEQGFYVMAGSDRCDWDVMTRNLGSEWFIKETEYKIHPSIGWNHPGYYATKQLTEEHDIKPENVEEIIITGMMLQNLGDTRPTSAVDAMFSLPYTVVTTIMRRPLLPSLYHGGQIDDPMVRKLLSRTRCVHDAEADALFFNTQRMQFSVEIRLRSGEVLRREIEFPRDCPPNGRAEVTKKFFDLSTCVISQSQAEDLYAVIDRLDEEPGVNRLIDLTVRKAG